MVLSTVYTYEMSNVGRVCKHIKVALFKVASDTHITSRWQDAVDGIEYSI